MNSIYRFVTRGFVLVLALFVAGQALAQVVPMSLSELTSGAQTVIRGKVLRTESKWIEDERGKHIYTVATIQVQEVLKGSAAANPITVMAPGGTVGEITEWVSHSNSFKANEEVVLFLDAKRGDVIGGHQGKLTVRSGNVFPGAAEVPLERFLRAVSEYVRDSSKAIYLDAMGPPKPGSGVENGPGINMGPAGESRSLVLDKSLLRSFSPADLETSRKAPAVPARTTGWQTVFSDDFEGTFPGSSWTLSYPVSPQAYWDDQDYLAHAGSKSVWCAQGGANGVPASGGQYVNNMNTWMVHGPFDLSDASDAEVLFWVNNSSQASSDYFQCLASINNNNFYGYRWSGSTGGWENYNFDLTNVPTLGNLTGQPQVWIAFRFLSGASQANYAGAFVDDVVIQKFVGLVPVITGITPSKASAGTDTEVTITGSNFGATKGSGHVNFFYRSGQPTIPGTVTSWSNTQIICTVPTGDINDYPASAGSGPVTVTASDGGTSAGYQIRVSFGNGGSQWPGASPVVDYRINENYAGATGEGAQVQAAANRWSNAGAWFTMHYAGTTTATSNSYDGVNQVMWASLGSGILGQASVWWNALGLVECDFTFSTGYTWSTDDSPESGEFDVQTIAVHEMGHWLYLRDIYGNIGDGVHDVAKIMYGFGSPGVTKRNLHADDIDGIRWLYGASGLPVQISSMGAVRVGGGKVELRWTTLSETENYGFQIERSATAKEGFVPLAGAFIPGHGTTIETHTYTYTDATAGESPWYYRIRQMDLDGSVHYTEVMSVQAATAVKEKENEKPNAFMLAQNYPNPFNPSTRIGFSLPEASHVLLTVYNALGQQVATLVDEEMGAGHHEVEFSSKGVSFSGGESGELAGGLYFYRLQAGSFVQTRTFVLLR